MKLLHTIIDHYENLNEFRTQEYREKLATVKEFTKKPRAEFRKCPCGGVEVKTVYWTNFKGDE